jgi:UDP-N-acetylmuramate--alanine ligase
VNVNKLRIGVLMGGRSIEREVSFNSGRTICDHLDTQRYDVIPIFQTEAGALYTLPPHFLHRGKISDFVHRLDAEANKISWDNLKELVDFIYLAVHGRYGEDGTIQGMLEVLGIPYLGAKVLGSALGMDKSIQKTILSSIGIDVPRGITLTTAQLKHITTEKVLERLTMHNVSLPVVVKPICEGSSLGVKIINDADQLLPAIIQASNIDNRLEQDVIVEEKITGMEFVCVNVEKITNTNGVISRSWMPFPLTELVLETDKDIFDYEQKYMPGKSVKVTPARCSDEAAQNIIRICQRASEALGFTVISRIDGFLSADGRIVLIDPNSLTGMSPTTFIFNQAAEIGMSYTDLINFLIENELHAYGLIKTSLQSSDREGNRMDQPQQKIRVAVLLAGDSNEREVSLDSGRNVCFKLSPNKYEPIPLFVNDRMELYKINHALLIKNTTRAIADRVTPDMRVEWSDLPTICDFVFIGLHGGKGEGGAVQGTLEMLDMPYNGPGVLASALCMDKFKANNFLKSKGFDVPDSVLVYRADWLALDSSDKELFVQDQLMHSGLTLPLIVKPHDDGCSVMVGKATTVIELIEKIDTFFTTSKAAVLIEEMIKGIELTVGVIGNDEVTALPPSMAVAKGGILSIEEKFLPGEGENQTPAPLPERILTLVRQVMEDCYKTVGCKGYSRIDCFYQDANQSKTGKERVVVLELNTLPGLTPATCIFHQAAEIGIKPMEFIDKLVTLGLELHGPKKSQPNKPNTPAINHDEQPLIEENTMPSEPLFIALEAETALAIQEPDIDDTAFLDEPNEDKLLIDNLLQSEASETSVSIDQEPSSHLPPLIWSAAEEEQQSSPPAPKAAEEPSATLDQTFTMSLF